MSDDQDDCFDKIMQAGMEALNEAGAKAQAKKAGDLFVKQAMENLRKAAEEAERKYARLSDDQWVEVIADLKEHLKLTELLNRPTKGMKIQ